MTQESAVAFQCGEEWLYGILHRPEHTAKRGVIVVVGGPQYRVGSHRQFLLLARHLAASGFAVLRFDYRGMGDSGGDERNFEDIDEDIGAAVDCLKQHVSEVEEVVLWGLCDAASALLFYASADPRISGLVLLNPWVRTDQTEARTYLRHYYLARLRDREFWRKLVRGDFRPGKALRSLFELTRRALTRAAAEPANSSRTRGHGESLPDRMLDGWRRFRGPVLLILSGDDITASEFRDTTTHSIGWKRALSERRVARFDLAEANHTFSRREWRDRVAVQTAEWLRAW